MAKRLIDQKISIEGLICIREALNLPLFKISRTKLLNALAFYGEKAPKPVMRFQKADWYNKEDFIAWGRKYKVKTTPYPDRTWNRKPKVKKPAYETSNFNLMAKAFITSKRV